MALPSHPLLPHYSYTYTFDQQNEICNAAHAFVTLLWLLTNSGILGFAIEITIFLIAQSEVYLLVN